MKKRDEDDHQVMNYYWIVSSTTGWTSIKYYPCNNNVHFDAEMTSIIIIYAKSPSLLLPLIIIFWQAVSGPSSCPGTYEWAVICPKSEFWVTKEFNLAIAHYYHLNWMLDWLTFQHLLQKGANDFGPNRTLHLFLSVCLSGHILWGNN